jgi:hypothetical protein
MKSVIAAVAFMAALGSSAAYAKDQYPPEAGSICDAGIAAYLGKVGTLKHGVIHVDFNLERDDNLYFNFYGEWEDKIKGVSLEDLPPIEGLGYKRAQQVADWAKDNGIWMVVTPGRNGMEQAQVFVAGEAKGKPACLALFKKPVPINPDNTPPDIFE